MTGSSGDEAAGRIREIDGYWNRGYGGTVPRSFVDELLGYALAVVAELERLKARGSHRTLDELAAEQGVGPFDPDAWPTPDLSDEEAAAFDAAIVECRGGGRLARLGDLYDEWNVGSDDGEPNYIRSLSEGDARFVAGRDAIALLHRYVSDWRKVDNPKQRQDGEDQP